MIKIIHLIDDKKFIEMCKLTFEGLPEIKNEYISSKNWDNNYDTKNIDFLFIHSLTLPVAKKLIRFDINFHVVWFVWGADIYTLGKFSNIMLNDEEKYIRWKLSFKNGLIKGFNCTIRTVFPKLIDKFGGGKDILNAIKKIDGIACHMPAEIDLIRGKYGFNKDYFIINYVNPILNIKESKISKVRNNILLGNSASFENNFFEIFKIIQKNVNFSGKIIIPLNYGNPYFKDYIINYVEFRKIQNIQFLTEFLSYDDYQEVIKGCGYAIMNHKRQQALGNIVQCLMEGIHLYMNKESSIYKFLVDNEFVVSTTSEVNNLRLLSSNEKKININKTKIYFNKKQQTTLLNKIFKKYGYEEIELPN